MHPSPNPHGDTFWLICAGILILLALALSAAEDSGALDRDLYCAKVHSGAWPDYESLASTECRAPHAHAYSAKPRQTALYAA